MATVTAVLVPRRWLRLPLRSARVRLTLLYSGMFLVLGSAVVVVIFLVGSSASAIQVSTATPASVAQGVAVAHALVSQQHFADVDRLAAAAWVTLAVTAIASAVLGWFAAGRVLRPLRDMTLAARMISAGNLHERIALTGPQDEFKQLGDTIDDLLARLEASFAAQRRFVANAAHELRTPLTLERTLLQVALGDPKASRASLRAACEEVIASSRDHERLLESLLTLAISERGLERQEPLDLADVVQTAVAASGTALRHASLTLSSDLEPAEISGDRTIIGRLVANLLDNAIEYNEPGGQVSVRTATDAGRAVLTVANSGPWLSQLDVERLFEPFRRLGTDRVGADGHHGLGLSIVRAAATAHDAVVTALPEPAGGLAITVVFPALEPAGSDDRAG